MTKKIELRKDCILLTLIDGGIGAGKSSFINSVSSGFIRDANNIRSVRDVFNNNSCIGFSESVPQNILTPFYAEFELQKYIGNPEYLNKSPLLQSHLRENGLRPRISFLFQMYMNTQRLFNLQMILFLINTFKSQPRGNSQSKIEDPMILVDRGHIGNKAFALVNATSINNGISIPEINLYEQLPNNAEKNIQCESYVQVYFPTTPDRCLLNIKTRNNKSEQGIPREYLVHLEQMHLHLLIESMQQDLENNITGQSKRPHIVLSPNTFPNYNILKNELDFVRRHKVRYPSVYNFECFGDVQPNQTNYGNVFVCNSIKDLDQLHFASSGSSDRIQSYTQFKNSQRTIVYISNTIGFKIKEFKSSLPDKWLMNILQGKSQGSSKLSTAEQLEIPLGQIDNKYYSKTSGIRIGSEKLNYVIFSCLSRGIDVGLFNKDNSVVC